MTVKNGFDVTDTSIKTVFNTVHVTDAYLATNDRTGVFVGSDSILLRAGNTSIAIGNNEININGRLIKEQMMSGTTRGLVDNPLGILPGVIIPPLIPSSFQYLPDINILISFASIGTQIANIITSVNEVINGY